MQILKTRNYRDVSVISSKFGHTETSSILCNAIADVHKTARNSAGGGGGAKEVGVHTRPTCSREQRVWSY